MIDIRFFRDNSLKPTIAINKDGTMNENAGQFKGMTTKEAQKAIVMELAKQNLIVKQTRIRHRTPICERSKDPIEFIGMKEYYLKQLDFRSEMLKIAEKPKFYSEDSRKILIDWINSVSIDWPLSRRRFYATEIPLWYCQDCKYIYIPEKGTGKYFKPWMEPCPLKVCPQCGSTGFIGEERVFDTWFDSSISPLYILKYSRDKEFFKENPTCSLRIIY